MILKIIFGLFLVLFLYGFVFKTLRTYLIYKKKYGDEIIIKFIPILGFFYYFKPSFENYGNSLYFFTSELRKNPKAKGILYLSGVQNWFVLTNNDWIKKFSQDQHKFLKNNANFAGQFMFKFGLVATEGNLWKRQRNFLNSTFHYNVMLNRIPMMKDTMKEFDEGIDNLNSFQKINTFDQTQKVTSEIVVKSFFGQSFKNIMCNGKQFAFELTQLTTDTMVHRMTPYFLIKSLLLGAEKASITFNNAKEKSYLNRIKNIVEQANKFIDERYETLKQQQQEKNNTDNSQPINLLDLYLKSYINQQQQNQNNNLQDYEKITKEEILHQFFILFFTGTDTTSHLASMALYELSKNTDVLQKLKQELKQNDIKSYANIEQKDLSKLDYLSSILKETLRLHPVTHFILPRKIGQDYNNGDLFVSKNVVVTTRLISQDQNKQFLKDIDTFKPERFMNNQEEIDPYDFIPFSAGPRNCIGQHMAILEAKLIVLYVIEKYNIKPVENYQLKMKKQILLSPVDKCNILLQKIQ